MSDDFERFIVERFLEFYNKQNNKKFEIVEKRDETIRDRPSYDYHCSDTHAGGELAIELKRLVARDTRFEANIKNWFKKYVKEALDFQFDGTYFVVLSLYELKESNFRNKNRRTPFFAQLKEQIANNKNKNEFIELSAVPKIGLVKIDDGGNNLFLWLINFSSADEGEIARILIKSLNKFSEDSDISRQNIILLLEAGTMCRRHDIADVIENLADDYDFSAINEIYNLAIWRETCIARIYPLDRIMESVFFSPENYEEKSKFIQKCIEYFR